jgi:uncharacterized membrane protein
VWTLDRAEQGGQALETLQQYAKSESSAVLSAALMIKDAEGETKLREIGDADARHGALFGAVTGGLIGLLGGPVGAIVGAAAGAVTGRAAAKRIDLGFPDAFLERIQERLQPGMAAVVVLAESQWTERVAEALAPFEGTPHRVELTDEALVQLAGELEAD